MTRIAEGDRVPLTEQQRVIWRQFLAAGTLDNKPLAVRISGPLDLGRLRQAVEALTARHEMLRAAFARQADELVQVARAAAPPAVSLVEVADAAEAERGVLRQITESFDPERGPLARFTAYRIKSGEHVLAVTLHPLLWDGWSRAVLARELIAAYLGDQSDSLPEPGLGYLDYARWQHAWLAGPEAEAAMRYWRDRLDGSTAGSRLPGHRGGRQTSAGRQLLFQLPADLAAAVAQASASAGVTQFTLLLAAFYTVISAASEQDSLSIGVPLANRVLPGTTEIVGQFVNTLPVLLDAGGDTDFRELLRLASAAVATVYEHQQLPFDVVTRTLMIEPARSSALVDITFNLLDGLAGITLPAAGVSLSALDLDTGRSDAELELTLERRGSELHGILACATDSYPDLNLAPIAAAYLAVLRTGTDDGAVSAAELRKIAIDTLNR